MPFKSIRPVVVFVSVLAVAAVSSCRSPEPMRQAAGPTRIALLSDLHVNRSTNATQRLYGPRLDQAIEAVNASRVDLVLVAGDLTENGRAAELGDFRRAMRRLQAPVFYVPGNHDVGNKRVPGKTGGTGFGRTRNYELECGKSFLVRREAGVRVIGVNSCLLGSGLPQEKRMWNLLERELAVPQKTPALLFTHHPPFIKTRDEPGGEYFNMEPYPRGRLLALANQGGALAILSGHLHQDLTNRVGRMVLYTTPPVSIGLPAGKQPEGWTLLSVAGTNLTWEFQPLRAAALPPAERR
jgi:3',5'-cyclic AMP phosphodiesterase CpdA